MRFNVAQQLKGPIGSVRRYDIEEELSDRGRGGTAWLSGSISLMRTDRGILVQGTLKGRSACTCIRCLTNFSQSMEFSVEEEYIPVEEIEQEVEEQTLETEGLIIDANHILDIEPVLREYAVLSAPMKPLCQPNCAGLCPGCGINLNDGSCSCDIREAGASDVEISSSDAIRIDYKIA